MLVEIPEAAAVGVVGRKNARPNANVNALYVTYGIVCVCWVQQTEFGFECHYLLRDCSANGSNFASGSEVRTVCNIVHIHSSMVKCPNLFDT